MECPHCGLVHKTTCPRIVEIEYRKDGSVKKIRLCREIGLIVPEVANGHAVPVAGVDKLDKLSAKELEVLGLLLMGDQNKLIARKLGIAEATVKVHVKAILRKYGLKNRTHLSWYVNSLRNGDVRGDNGLDSGCLRSNGAAPEV